MEKSEEVVSITDKVLAFGIISVLLIITGACGVLLFFLYSTSSKLIAEREYSLELKTELAAQHATIYDLRRSLDQTVGRLGVYEDFLIGTRTSSLKKMMKRYLNENQITASRANLKDFESWALSQTPYKTHMGVGGR